MEETYNLGTTKRNKKLGLKTSCVDFVHQRIMREMTLNVNSTVENISNINVDYAAKWAHFSVKMAITIAITIITISI